jgi:hypothetical protein
MSRATIAAVIPVRNKAAFIERSLLSAMAQIEPADEIIVVDDASTDASMRIVREVAARHPHQRITTLFRSAPGPGGYAARNHAIQSTDAQWIAFLDADDAWHPDFLHTVRSAIADGSPDLGAVYTSRLIVQDGQPPSMRSAHSRGSGAPCTVDFDGFIEAWRELGYCPIWMSACAMRRDVLIDAGMFPAGRCERGGDKDAWIRVMSRTKAIASPVVGATYYLNVAGQVTQTACANRRHCVCDTLIPMIRASTGRRKNTLKWIFNTEMQLYARQQFGVRPLSPNVYGGFYAEQAPAAYLALRAISLTPLPVQRAVRAMLLGLPRAA